MKELMLTTKMIGNRIVEARKKVNISQAELALRLFISSQAVGKWERGESMPDIVTFNRLAEVLGVDLNYFSESFPSNKAGSTSVDPLEKELQVKPTKKQLKNLNWDMSRGNWVEANFSGLKNLHEKFSSSNMQRCLFVGSDLSGLQLKGNNVEGCDFSGSDIGSSHIQGSNLVNNIFKDCTLKEAEFSKSYVNGCDFSGVNFTGTKFSGSYIYGCGFTGADFTGVMIKSGGFTGVAGKSGSIEKNTIVDAIWNRSSFIDTQIADIIIEGTLEDCYFENCVFTRVVFQNAILRNTFFKNNKRLKKIRFVDCKADRITYEFLKQGKADLTGVALLTT